MILGVDSFQSFQFSKNLDDPCCSFWSLLNSAVRNYCNSLELFQFLIGCCISSLTRNADLSVSVTFLISSTLSQRSIQIIVMSRDYTTSGAVVWAKNLINIHTKRLERIWKNVLYPQKSLYVSVFVGAGPSFSPPAAFESAGEAIDRGQRVCSTHESTGAWN